MNPEQLQQLIESVLSHLDPIIPPSRAATKLLMLTAAVETNLGEYIYQKHGGPGQGIFQMETQTLSDLWEYISRKRQLSKKMADFGYLDPHQPAEFKLQDIYRDATDLVYQILMARIFYWRIPKPLPDAEDTWGLARYWKRYWNTRHGAGTTRRAILAYNTFVLGEGNHAETTTNTSIDQ